LVAAISTGTNPTRFETASYLEKIFKHSPVEKLANSPQSTTTSAQGKNVIDVQEN